MKKSIVFRTRLLGTVAVAAIIFAGFCSKDQTEEPDGTNAVLQTRATPVISFYSMPEAQDEGKNLLSLTSGRVSMPYSEKQVRTVILSWSLFPEHPNRLHWDLTIPENAAAWRCVYDPDIVGPFDPDKPGAG